MTFKEYDQIIKTHGIGELSFLYREREYQAMMGYQHLKLYYYIYDGKAMTAFDGADELVSAKFFDGKSLEDIWEEITILEIDGASEDAYDVEACSFDFVNYLKSQGELQWSYSLGVKKSFLLQLKYALFGMLLVLLPVMLLPILHVMNWNGLLFFGGIALIVFSIAAFAIWRNQIDISYEITTEKIFVFNGLSLETSYDNVKRVKLKRSLFHRNVGTVKLYLKKGLSMNYHLQWVPDCDKVYALILANMKKE